MTTLPVDTGFHLGVYQRMSIRLITDEIYDSITNAVIVNELSNGMCKNILKTLTQGRQKQVSEAALVFYLILSKHIYFHKHF